MLLLALLSGWASVIHFLHAEEVAIPPLPAFSEVFDLVQTNLPGATPAELNRAAVLGFVEKLQPRVSLVGTNGVRSADLLAIPLVSKATVFDGTYGFIRIGRVGPGLEQAVATALDRIRATNRLKGLMLDLRFAVGQDYSAAAATADLFFKTEQPLLQWGEKTARSTAKSTSVELPFVLLINSETSGAAEALAVALRQADDALLIGSPTAGRAYLYSDFPLSNGETLRIAGGTITAGTGQRLSDKGVVPDIVVAVNPADEKSFFEDPYKTPARASVSSGRVGNADLASNQSTNRPRRRLNEAELVRMQHEGIEFEGEPPAPSTPQIAVAVAVIADPALSRGLDLLKGLALAVKRH
jgi:hypothetical protein